MASVVVALLEMGQPDAEPTGEVPKVKRLRGAAKAAWCAGRPVAPLRP
ncbi:hypothetical protein AB4305_29720 [Nocardia sp. 2YAB30]